MIAIVLPSGERADLVQHATELWVYATSLGGVESTLERRRRWKSEPATIPEGLIRLSVGIEDVEDLWEDLRPGPGRGRSRLEELRRASALASARVQRAPAWLRERGRWDRIGAAPVWRRSPGRVAVPASWRRGSGRTREVPPMKRVTRITTVARRRAGDGDRRQQRGRHPRCPASDDQPMPPARRADLDARHA